MQRLLALTLLAGFALVGAPSVHAATPQQATFVVTYTLDYTHSESDRPGTVLGIHAGAVMHMHQTWTGTRYTCRFDPYTLHTIVNGHVQARPMPAVRCNGSQDTGQFFSSMDFTRVPKSASTHWTDDQTMTVSQALQWPIDATIAPYLSPVSWHTTYRSDGNTFVTSHGTGAMLEDRTLAGGAAHLHAHLVGTSGMSVRLHPQAGQALPMTLTMHQEATMFLQVHATTTGATVSEQDHSQLTATAHPI